MVHGALDWTMAPYERYISLWGWDTEITISKLGNSEAFPQSIAVRCSKYWGRARSEPIYLICPDWRVRVSSNTYFNGYF